ncbi:hypothetical protein [Endozoicomonas numazuensis]|uniref:YtkA-like domain-containing protein n=1 Tax=Endozoicomonas numazuensis TaxID=1137799 RepID=A0A081NMY1_9GAMM|nr:hypothetical protein [Endozoicomonas numazuensis]KEQ19804.1 hypothetical protein GZ78_08070 [Endozoicomonas numazuensis]
MKIKQYTGLGVSLVLMAALVFLPSYFKSKSETELAQQSYQKKCLVAEGCRLMTGDRHIELNIKPSSLPKLEPLDIEVRLEGVPADKVTMEFFGRDMPMGLAPFPLYKQPSLLGPSIYSGIGNLAFCTVDKKMTWLARLVIESDSVVTTVVFELES